MTAPGLVCGPCGTELPPNAKSYNESAVPKLPGSSWVGAGSRKPAERGGSGGPETLIGLPTFIRASAPHRYREATAKRRHSPGTPLSA